MYELLCGSLEVINEFLANYVMPCGNQNLIK
jgi:hypothetical protein